MKTFDYSLFELYNDGSISYDEAIRNADSANELRLNIKLNGTRPAPAAPQAAANLKAWVMIPSRFVGCAEGGCGRLAE